MGLKPDRNTVIQGVFPAALARPRKNALVLAFGSQARGSRQEVIQRKRETNAGARRRL